MSFREISEALGITQQAAYEIYTSAIRKLRARPYRAQGLAAAIREREMDGTATVGAIFAARAHAFGRGA